MSAQAKKVSITRGVNKQKFNNFLFNSLIFLSFALIFLSILERRFPERSGDDKAQNFSPLSVNGNYRLIQFGSEEEFKIYLQAAAATSPASFNRLTANRMLAALPAVDLQKSGGMEPLAGEGGTPERISGTNVQVPGVDEPDIVKTDGREIYYSGNSLDRLRTMRFDTFSETPLMKTVTPPIPAETKIIRAFPPEELIKESSIGKTGDLLLDKNILIILSGNSLTGYDVSKPEAPTEKWQLNFDGGQSLVQSRLKDGQIYLVARTNINQRRPCPVSVFPAENNPAEFSIGCREIYHPIQPLATDTVYTVIIINPQDGKVGKTLSFTGDAGNSVIYMSEKSLYVTYTYSGDLVNILYGFFNEMGRDLLPAETLSRIERLQSYEIGQAAKLIEMQTILEQYQNFLGEDEKLRIDNEINNRVGPYLKARKRELEKTGIVKVGLPRLEITAVGEVPGQPLNQFSLDEYRENLRIAVTLNQTNFLFFPAEESVSDVYVLDQSLKKLGSVLDLGVSERIYSVRFVEDKGYVVTFRQTDPFYVLDLSQPENPELKGELKIPGYSAYLHPITKDKIIGIGKEESQVKVSLFDVQSAEEPKEAAKYLLNETWSDILQTHHAFLLDRKHQIFFLPGVQGGYIFSYENDELKLVKAVSGIFCRRALYLNDYLYIIGDDKITVLNETDWSEVNRLDL